MVIFDQLRISDDGKKMYINAHINNAKDSLGGSPFESVYITQVVICEAGKVYETMDLDSIIEKKQYLKRIDYLEEEEKKEIALVLDVNDLMRHDETEIKKINFCQEEMYSTLFFVFIRCTDANDVNGCLPCYMTKTVTVNAVFDDSTLYQKMMSFTKELAQDCTVPQGFTDFILLWNAFKASVETEHFVAAKGFYDKLFGASNASVSSTNKGCGCHG